MSATDPRSSRTPVGTRTCRTCGARVPGCSHGLVDCIATLKADLGGALARGDAAERDRDYWRNEAERLRVIVTPPDVVARVARVIHDRCAGGVPFGPQRGRNKGRVKVSAELLARDVLEVVAQERKGPTVV